MTDSPTWAQVIRQRRESLGLSKAQVARAANINEKSYGRYESAEREPPLSAARAIAEALDLSLAELAGQIPSGLEIDPGAGALSVVGEVIQARRHELGLTQTRVASAAGLPLDLYQRYESGEAELPLATAAVLADVLDISLAVLAGAESRSIELNGRWWATWQSAPLHPGEADFHLVDALRVGNRVLLDKGWRGELELFGNEVLIGWYRPPGHGTRTRQGIFLWLPTGCDYLYGRWTGVADNNTVTSGWCVLAREEATSREVFQTLLTSKTQPRPVARLPRLGTWGSQG
jgi:transcriptional regulator with XRE-family HTH domain